jgi:hypothetical protein
MMTPEDFASTDPRALYDHMRPDQRTAIANEFVRYLRLAGDPAVAEFDAEERARRTGNTNAGTTKRGFDAVAPQLETAEEVASIHMYIREHHPDIFEQVAHHPVTVASLANPGARVDDAVQQEEVIVQTPPAAVEVNAPDRREIPNRDTGGEGSAFLERTQEERP